jgi:hypothetical protein
LGTLEKRLAETKHLSQSQSQRASTAPVSNPTSPSQSSPNEGEGSTPRSTLASPEPPSKNGDKDKEKNKRSSASAEPEKEQEEVEALSDMMCSLVTNNCGETRYIGMKSVHKTLDLYTHNFQDHLPDSPYFRPKVFNGSMKKQGILLSRK